MPPDPPAAGAKQRIAHWPDSINGKHYGTAMALDAIDLLQKSC